MKTVLHYSESRVHFSFFSPWRLRALFIFLFTTCLTAGAIAQAKLWDRTLGGPGGDIFSASIATADGGYLVGGSSTSGIGGDKSQASQGGSDYWIVKTDAKGNRQWDKTFGGSSDDRLAALIATPDGGYLLGGLSNSRKSGDKSQGSKGNSDFWIVKVDDKGNKQWDKTFGGTGYDVFNSLALTADGGFLLAGYSVSGKGGDKSQANNGSSDYWVVKTDASGAKVWDRTYGGNGYDGAFEGLNKVTIVAAPGGYLLGGSSESGVSGDKSGDSRGGSDYWLLKIDESGKKVWDKTIGGNSSDWLNTILLTNDGGYLLGGTSTSGADGDKTEQGRPDYEQFWVVKIDVEGNKEWDKTLFGGEYGGEEYDNLLYSLVATPQGGYLVGGFAAKGAFGDKTEAGRGFWVVGLDAAGRKVWDKLYGSYTSMLSVSDGYLLGGSQENAANGIDYHLTKLDNRGKADQSIVFTPVPIKMYGQAPFTVGAKTNTGLPVVLSIASGPATIQDSIITLTGPGVVVLKATQAGNELYNAAMATQNIIVEEAKHVLKVWDRAYYASWDIVELKDMVATADSGALMIGVYHPGSGMNPPERFILARLDRDGNKVWENTDFPFEPGAIVAGTDGSYLIADVYSERGRGRRIMKIDGSGNKLWEKKLSEPDNYNELSKLVATPDGGYLLGSTSYPGAGASDFYVLKIDANGNKLWDKTLGGNGSDLLSDVVVAPDGGVLLGGSSTSGISQDKTQANRGGVDYWVIKLDAKGNKVWDKTFGGANDEQFSALVALPDGTFFLGGSSRSGISGDKSAASKDSNEISYQRGDYWLVKIDEKGNKIWDKTFGGNASDGLNTMVTTPDGNVLLGGYSYSSISGDKTEGSRGYNDYWIVKIDNNGNKLWDKRLGSNSSEGLTEIVVNTAGDYILGGISYSGISGDKTETAGWDEGNEFWIVKLTENVPSPPVATAWNLRYGGAATDRFAVVIKTADGGYISGGYSNSGISGDKTHASKGGADYWVVKTDQNGIRQWDKTYGGLSHDYLNRIIQTNDGGYLLAGSSISGVGGDKSQRSHGNQDYWIIKISSNGEQEWDRTYGGSGFDDLRKVNQLPDGGYLLAGTSDSPLSGDKSMNSRGGQDYWVVRITATGDKLWDKRYGGSADEHLESFNKTSDGGFVLAGSSASGIGGEKSQPGNGGNDYWLIKIDANGVKLWDKSYGGSGADALYSIGYTSKDEFFVAGHSTSGKNGDKSQESQGGSDFWMLKLDRNGEKVWDKSFGGSGREELRSIIQAPDGGYVLAGSSDSPVSSDKTQTSQGGMDYWLVKTDASGNKEYDQRFGGAGQEEFRYIQRTDDGGYLLGGRSESGASGDRAQPSQGGMDYWLVKVAPRENTTSQASLAELPAEPELVPEPMHLRVYPNPATEKVTASFSLEQTQQVTLEVYDSQGRKIAILYQGEARAGQFYEATWQPTGRQKDGMYVVRLRTAERVSHQKIILSR